MQALFLLALAIACDARIERRRVTFPIDTDPGVTDVPAPFPIPVTSRRVSTVTNTVRYTSTSTKTITLGLNASSTEAPEIPYSTRAFGTRRIVTLTQIVRFTSTRTITAGRSTITSAVETSSTQTATATISEEPSDAAVVTETVYVRPSSSLFPSSVSSAAPRPSPSFTPISGNDTCKIVKELYVDSSLACLGFANPFLNMGSFLLSPLLRDMCGSYAVCEKQIQSSRLGYLAACKNQTEASYADAPLVLSEVCSVNELSGNKCFPTFIRGVSLAYSAYLYGTPWTPSISLSFCSSCSQLIFEIVKRKVDVTQYGLQNFFKFVDGKCIPPASNTVQPSVIGWDTKPTPFTTKAFTSKLPTVTRT